MDFIQVISILSGTFSAYNRLYFYVNLKSEREHEPRGKNPNSTQGKRAVSKRTGP
jgi:hypothetical protein